MSEGWIKLHRGLIDHDIWTQESFTRGQAWVDLLLLANHTQNQFRVRGNLVIVSRGEVARSEESLALRWKWSRNKVRRFIEELSSKTIQQIEQQKSPILNKIRIINYDLYQAIDQSETTDGTTERQQTEQQKDTNKNDKKEKNDKNEKKRISVAFAPPSIEEIKTYFISKNSNEIEALKFHSFYESKGWKVGKSPMKKWESAASGWILRNKTEVKANGNDLDLSKYSEEIRLRIQNAPNVLRYCAEKVHTCIYLKFRDPHMGELCREYRISNQINPINPFELKNDRKIMERYIAIMEAQIYCDQIDGISKVHGSGFYVPYGENYGRKNT